MTKRLLYMGVVAALTACGSERADTAPEFDAGSVLDAGPAEAGPSPDAASPGLSGPRLKEGEPIALPSTAGPMITLGPGGVPVSVLECPTGSFACNGGCLTARGVLTAGTPTNCRVLGTGIPEGFKVVDGVVYYGTRLESSVRRAPLDGSGDMILGYTDRPSVLGFVGDQIILSGECGGYAYSECFHSVPIAGGRVQALFSDTGRNASGLDVAAGFAYYELSSADGESEQSAIVRRALPDGEAKPLAVYERALSFRLLNDDWMLLSRDHPDGPSQALFRTSGEGDPIWLPAEQGTGFFVRIDGSYFYWRRNSEELGADVLERMPLTGGPVEPVAQFPASVSYDFLLDNGSLYFAADFSGNDLGRNIYRMPLGSTVATRVASVDEDLTLDASAMGGHLFVSMQLGGHAGALVEIPLP